MPCEAWLLLYVQVKNCSARWIVGCTSILLRLLYPFVITTDAVWRTHMQHEAGKISTVFLAGGRHYGCANTVFWKSNECKSKRYGSELNMHSHIFIYFSNNWCCVLGFQTKLTIISLRFSCAWESGSLNSRIVWALQLQFSLRLSHLLLWNKRARFSEG